MARLAPATIAPDTVAPATAAPATAGLDDADTNQADANKAHAHQVNAEQSGAHKANADQAEAEETGAEETSAEQAGAEQAVAELAGAHKADAEEPASVVAEADGADDAAPEGGPVADHSVAGGQASSESAAVERADSDGAAGAEADGASPGRADSDGADGAGAAGGPAGRATRPVVKVTGDRAGERPLRVVERALRSQPGRGSDGWRGERVVVVPGGHRPGKPDQLQRDRARARLPVEGSRRIVVLGCTRGAGQTTTVLLAGDMLASLRGQPVAALDLNPGRGSLTEQAAAIPGLVQGSAGTVGYGMPAMIGGPAPDTGLQVISGSAAAAGGDDAGRILDLVAARYRLTIADPAASYVPRTLDVADQLLIVAPASAEAAGALAMTFEWLEANGHGRLAATAITVLNGVSGPTTAHVEQAANVATGRCRAIVKVPWDSQLKELSHDRGSSAATLAADGDASHHNTSEGHSQASSHHASHSHASHSHTSPHDAHHSHPASGDARATLPAPAGPQGTSLLGPGLTQAYTALAGVLVAGLADPGQLRSARV